MTLANKLRTYAALLVTKGLLPVDAAAAVLMEAAVALESAVTPLVPTEEFPVSRGSIPLD